MTLTSGMAATHQSILGNRTRLALDERLAVAVTGDGPLAAPGLVWDVAIGQSTVATQNVRANLFYRGLVFSRYPVIGDTLTTTTTVAGLRQNRRRAGRASTGLAALRIDAVDQHGRTVLDFWRCAMIPLGDPDAETGAADDLDAVGAPATDQALAAAVAGWRLETCPVPARNRRRARVGGGRRGRRHQRPRAGPPDAEPRRRASDARAAAAAGSSTAGTPSASR